MKRQFTQTSESSEEESNQKKLKTGVFSTIINFGTSLFSNFFRTPDEGVINYFPDELLKGIMTHLPLKDLHNQLFVSSRFHTLCDSVFEQCYLPKLPSFFGVQYPLATASQKVITFRSLSQSLSKGFKPELVAALGEENIAALPIITHVEKDKGYGRAEEYIRLCAKFREDDKDSIVSTTFEIGYSRLTDGGFWIYKGKDMLPHAEFVPCCGTDENFFLDNNAGALDYLSRLVRNEPCGKIVDGKETEPKIDALGNSMVTLCDHLGNTLDFSQSLQHKPKPKF